MAMPCLAMRPHLCGIIRYLVLQFYFNPIKINFSLPSVDRLPIFLLALLVAICSLLACLALLRRAGGLAVRAYFEAEVALDQRFTFGRKLCWWSSGSTATTTGAHPPFFPFSPRKKKEIRLFPKWRAQFLLD